MQKDHVLSINFYNSWSIDCRSKIFFVHDWLNKWQYTILRHVTFKYCLSNMTKIKYDLLPLCRVPGRTKILILVQNYIIPKDCVINRFTCSSSFISHLHKSKRIFKIDRYLEVWQKFSLKILNNSRPLYGYFTELLS